MQAGVPAALARFDQNLTHEFSVAYTWTLNPHFDIRLTGNMIIPLDGAKDIADTRIATVGGGLAVVCRRGRGVAW